jgi:phosphatidylserine/phosphatidylglycerophosphate/cardiolipin synthase-like enzyme
LNPRLGELEIFELARKDLLAGTLPPSLVEGAFQIAEEERRRRNASQPLEEEPPLEAAPVLVAPLALRRRSFHGWVSDRSDPMVYPLWIAAQILRDGSLEGDSRHPPWIPRQYLEPVYGDGWTAGLLEAFDTFLTQETPPFEAEWAEVLTYAADLFQAVTGSAPQDYHHEDFEVIGPRLVVLQVEKGFNQGLIDLVDWVQATAPELPILRSLAESRPPSTAPKPGHDPEVGTLDHLGQMTDRFPLSPSQRQSLGCVLRLEDGEVLAVNGPPGTGKTTLVQSIVASLWVQAAVDGGEPPLIHVCSTNNQAVTNVLDSFDSAADEDAQGIAVRWLPEVRSYGVFFPASSQTKKAEAKKYQTAELRAHVLHGSLGVMETSDFVRDAKEHYLRQAVEVLNLPPSRLTVQEVLDRLQSRLQQEAEDLRQRSQAVREAKARQPKGPGGPWTPRDLAEHLRVAEEEAESFGGLRRELLERCRTLPWYLEFFEFLRPVRRRRNRWLTWPLIEVGLPVPALGREGFEEVLVEHLEGLAGPKRKTAALLRWLDEGVARLSPTSPVFEALLREENPWHWVAPLLDVGQRFRLFHLAGRYWEGRWLVEMEKLNSKVEGPELSPREARLTRYRRIAKLAPLLVSTLYRSPRVFDYYDKEDGRGVPLVGDLDLLIVDEAGQVPPEIGAAVLPLARRAVIIGDEHQVEPIWGVHRRVDSANLRSVGLDGESEALDAFRCSSSSLLRLAQRATRWTDPQRRDGLFLREHRRCVPQIIAYCNELVYGGQLEPMRDPVEGGPLPCFGWAHVRSAAQKRGGSWVNEGEAWAIARWLHHRRASLETFYGRPLEDIVGVVTPFAAQKAELIKALSAVNTEWRDPRPVKGKKRKPPPVAEVGTVHTFQGAEREIILFSPVYSAETVPGRRFFDNGKNLLNVAVSRAKDSFLVFGDLEIFDPASPAPSGLLAQHLFRFSDNEVTDVPGTPELHRAAEAGKVPVRPLVSLEDHRQVLVEAFRGSQERVLVVSPYVSRRALEADDVLEEIRKACARGVQVRILYCLDLHRNLDLAKSLALAMREVGAEVYGVDRVHSKHLSVDRRWFVEGSFNWLSAVRDRDDRWQRLETSLRCEYFGAEQAIDEVWQKMEERAQASRL